MEAVESVVDFVEFERSGEQPVDRESAALIQAYVARNVPIRDPAGMREVLTTAPTPVSMAHPNRAASANGSSGSTFTSERRETVAYSANPILRGGD